MERQGDEEKMTGGKEKIIEKRTTFSPHLYSLCLCG
jgi:hypothetical protein